MAMGQVALPLLQKNQTAAENLMAMDDSSPQKMFGFRHM
jgi:hypothetical protein